MIAGELSLEARTVAQGLDELEEEFQGVKGRMLVEDGIFFFIGVKEAK